MYIKASLKGADLNVTEIANLSHDITEPTDIGQLEKQVPISMLLLIQANIYTS